MTNIETKVTTIEILSDSETWLQVRHALREAGYKCFLQPNLFDHSHANLFLERRTDEPEGGQLKHGLLVYDGGVQIDSRVSEVYEQEVSK